MKTITVEAGSCGYLVKITVTGNNKNRISIMAETECEMVNNMVKALDNIQIRDLFKRLIENPVYKAATFHLKHTSCPVPVAILKAVEAEAGLAVAKDVKITFHREE